MRQSHAVRRASRPLFATASAFALVLGTAAAVHAQASAAPPPPGAGDSGAQVDTVIVTAERRSENLQKAPVSITAFTGAALKQRGVINLQNLSTVTPNLELRQTTRPAGGGSTYAAFIRGVGNGDYQFPSDPSIGLYVDGVYLARTIGGLLSLNDIDQIEVDKGPQGTLFGRNTLGGAIAITTLKPILQGAPTGTLEARVGSYGRADLLGVVRAPIIDDVLGVKFSLASIHLDGYQKLLDGDGDVGSEGRIIGRFALLYKPNDRFALDINADYTHQRQTPIIGAVLGENDNASATIKAFNMYAAPYLDPGLGLPTGTIFNFTTTSPFQSYETDKGYDNNDIGGVGVTATYDVSPALSIKSITAYRALTSKVRISGDSSPYYINDTTTPSNDQQFSQELQFSGKVFNNRLTYVGGLYYFWESGQALQETLSYDGLYQATVGTPHAAGVDDSTYALDNNTLFKETVNSYAAFGQATFALTPSIDLTAGVRVTEDVKDYTTSVLYTQLPDGGLGIKSAAIAPTEVNHSWVSTTPKFGVDWKPTDDFMVYASYSEGYKSGGFGSAGNTDFGHPNNTVFIPTILPETLTAFELGFKSQWFDHRLTFNAAVFQNYWNNVQITVISNMPVINLKTLENGGNVSIPGFEAELDAVPIDGLRLNIGVGYNHARFSKVDPAAATAILPLALTVGTRFPYIPDLNVDAGAQYTFALGELGDLTIRGDLSYKSDIYLNLADPSSHQPAYTLFSARVSYVPSKWRNLELYVDGQNLTNQTYAVYKQTSSATGEQLYIPGEPLMVNVGAILKF